MVQVKAGRTWSVWQLAQVDLGGGGGRVYVDGIAPGTATITATTNEAFTASCVVTVA